LRRFKPIVVLLAAAAAHAQSNLPVGRGRDVVKRVCTRCHASDVFASQAHSKREWTDIVHEMQNAGAKATKSEVREIVDYLARTFPPR
jgi:cytochrome c5